MPQPDQTDPTPAQEAPVTDQKSTGKVGGFVDVKDGKSVVRPDGEIRTVMGGSYYLDTPGIHVVDGAEITVKA